MYSSLPMFRTDIPGTSLTFINVYLLWSSQLEVLQGQMLNQGAQQVNFTESRQVGLLSTQQLHNAGAILIFSHLQHLPMFTFAIGSGNLK